uniref:Ribonuclease H protein At1g65750 family n=1 Tax=Cajanus cajan TaxID=3821 RepID=A0A151S8M6_CAJCA|nr:Putative ribonuclease H protein At1g65750 family [Cajanus cajan]
MSFPFTYLRIPTGANPRRVGTWDGIVAKLSKKLAAWKHKSLSLAGRVCLINFVLTSLPLFFLSFFKMPSGVVKKVETLQRNFLWGVKEGSKKVAWVRWKKICDEKKNGGLGIKSITMFNDALLAKWRWGLWQQRGHLWVELLQSKYEGWRGLCRDEGEKNDQYGSAPVPISKITLYVFKQNGSFCFRNSSFHFPDSPKLGLKRKKKN